MRTLAIVLAAAVLTALAATVNAGNNAFLASDDFETMLWGENQYDHQDLRFWWPQGTVDPNVLSVTQSSDRAHSGTYSARMWTAGIIDQSYWASSFCFSDIHNPDPILSYPSEPEWWWNPAYSKVFVDASIYIWDDYDPDGDPNEYSDGFRLDCIGGNMSHTWWAGAGVGIEPTSTLTHYTVSSSLSPSGRFVTDIERRHGWTQFRITVAGDYIQLYVEDQLAYECPFTNPNTAVNGVGIVNLMPLTLGGPSERGLYIDDWSSVTQIPEPCTLMLLGLGGAALLRRGCKRG